MTRSSKKALLEVAEAAREYLDEAEEWIAGEWSTGRAAKPGSPLALFAAKGVRLSEALGRVEDARKIVDVHGHARDCPLYNAKTITERCTCGATEWSIVGS